MKKNLTHLIVSVLFFTTMHAQYNNAVNHGQDSIIKVIPDGRHILYTIGGKLSTLQDVKSALRTYPASAVEINKASANATAGFILIGASGVSGIIAVAEFARDNKVANTTLNPDGTFTTVSRSKAAAEILTSVAIGGTVAALICLVKANQHGRRAINLYNQHFE
jgi:hypothetical protein